MDFIAKRRSKPGPENDMVQLFLSCYEFLFEHDSELSLTVLTEPKIGISFPDIVLVYWDRSMLVNWTETRQNLAIKDQCSQLNFDSGLSIPPSSSCDQIN